MLRQRCLNALGAVLLQTEARRPASRLVIEGAPQVRITHIGALQVGAPQVGALQVSAVQVGVA
jgi:hypothetical protein